MKVAIVHDWLGTTRGGAESVFLRIAKLYPGADIFCLTYNAKTYPEFSGRKVTTSWLGKLPSFLRKRTGFLTVFAPAAIERLNLEGYDLVISSSSSFAKGVRVPQNAKHICYCYTPMRYVWDYWPQWLEERAHNPISRLYINWLTHRLRIWDYESSKGVDKWIAISRTVAQRIRKYYHQPSTMVYSGIIDTAKFWNPKATKLDYYITVSTLTSYKKVDLAIVACIASKRKLMIVGDGPDAGRLKKLAEGHDNIVFMGRVSEEAKIQYLQEARGLIFANEEDFGIAPLEAVAAGTPVIAYQKGGLTETIQEGKSGLFFAKQTPRQIMDTLDRFEAKKWDAETVHKLAAPFDVAKFDAAFVAAVDKAGQRG